MGNESSSTYAIDPDGGFPLSNPKNNHDHLKVRHENPEDARRAKENMIRKNKPGAEDLVTYKNEKTGGYYNGRPKSSDTSSSAGRENEGNNGVILLIGAVLYGTYCAGSWLLSKADDKNSKDSGDDSKRRK